MPVKYGIIGCGAIGQRRHIPECHANPHSVVAALCDPNEQRVKELAAKYGSAAYTDWKHMLADADIDAVVVCGPNSVHGEQSIAALKAGKHVLCEKPMATSRDEAKAMLAAAKKSKKYLMIGLNQRLMAPHVKAKEILASGRLGNVIAFRTAFQHPGPEGWSVDGAKSWFFQKGSAFMGVTGDLGVHKADLMRWLLGQEFAEVGGFITTLDKRSPDGKLIPLDDNAYLTLRTTGGIVGSMILSWTNYGAEENYTILMCQNGVLKLGADPNYGVVVEYRNGDRECHKFGEIAANRHSRRATWTDAATVSVMPAGGSTSTGCSSPRG